MGLQLLLLDLFLLSLLQCLQLQNLLQFSHFLRHLLSLQFSFHVIFLLLLLQLLLLFQFFGFLHDFFLFLVLLNFSISLCFQDGILHFLHFHFINLFAFGVD